MALTGPTSLSLFRVGKWSQPISYSHKLPVTAVAIHKHDLIVGDEKGKIYLLPHFLQAGKAALRQKL